MKKIILAFLFLLSARSFANCSPINQFEKMMLGVSPDESQYAIGIFDEVTNAGETKDKNSSKAKICLYNVSDNKQVSCDDLALKKNNTSSFVILARNKFSTNHKGWSLDKVEDVKSIDAILDCREATPEIPKCIVEISEYVGTVDRRILLKTFHETTSHKEISPFLYTENDGVFVSKNKNVVCYQFNLPHSSASCDSNEDLIYCGKIKP
jgi:hypothetical protein